jgi:diamine N-acetyltransferase
MLVGANTVLRPWDCDDLQLLQQLRNNVILQTQLMAKPRGSSLEQVRNWLSRRSSDPNSVLLVIADRGTNNALGYIQIVDMSYVSGFGHLGVCLAPTAQGHGYAYEAVSLLEQYVISVFKMRKILLEVLESNERAIRLYVRCGFREAGKLLQHYPVGDIYENVIVMEKILKA